MCCDSEMEAMQKNNEGPGLLVVELLKVLRV
jgi:hypothetical protein